LLVVTCKLLLLDRNRWYSSTALQRYYHHQRHSYKNWHFSITTACWA